MDAEQQQGRACRQRLLFESDAVAVRPETSGTGGTHAGIIEEWQASTASGRKRAWSPYRYLMEAICDRENLNRAYKRVKANRGAAGVDGMTVGELLTWLAEHKDALIASLLDGTYQPQPVRGVQIPKPGGGPVRPVCFTMGLSIGRVVLPAVKAYRTIRPWRRQLGLPTVVDRLIQQAILQVLNELLDPTFSDSSYGFRPRRSAHDALKQAQEYVAEGRVIVVDMDLEKIFDRVNHDMLMARLARRVGDKRLLKIIRRFLEAGMMQNGVCVARHEGTPQGGPLTPQTILQTWGGFWIG